MPLAFSLYIRKKLRLSKQQRSNKGFVFSSPCYSLTSSSQCSNKAVHFSDTRSTVYYTYSSNDYDRGSYDIDDVDMGHQLRTDTTIDLDVVSHVNDDGMRTTSIINNSDIDYDRTQQEMYFDDECRRNTKINKKRGYHSVAILVHYRSNF